MVHYHQRPSIKISLTSIATHQQFALIDLFNICLYLMSSLKYNIASSVFLFFCISITSDYIITRHEHFTIFYFRHQSRFKQCYNCWMNLLYNLIMYIIFVQYQTLRISIQYQLLFLL